MQADAGARYLTSDGLLGSHEWRERLSSASLTSKNDADKICP
jgi:hypothetical protein